MGLFSGTSTSTQTTAPDAERARYQSAYGQSANNTYNRMSGGLNPQLQEYLNAARSLYGNFGFGTNYGLGGVESYFNPYQDAVIGGIQGDFDLQRGAASNRAAEIAAKSGAFGGNRQAVLEASALNDINRSEANTLAQLRSHGFSEAANRLMSDQNAARQVGLQGFNAIGNTGRYADQAELAALSALLPTAGFGGTTQTQSTPNGGLFGKLVGLGSTIAGALLPGGGAASSVANSMLPGGEAPVPQGFNMNDYPLPTFGSSFGFGPAGY